jgi:regulator of nonsense transcripts 1
MQSLDLWLEQVDTTEVLPLFSEEAREYTVPSRSDALSSSSPPWLIQIVVYGDLEPLTRLESIEQYKLVFTTLRSSNDKGLLLLCFKYILSNLERIVVKAEPLAQILLETLDTEPPLVVAFVPILSMPETPEQQDLGEVLEASLLPIMRAFILSANTMGHLILEPLTLVLSSISPGSLSLSDLADIIELAALTIRSTDLALDLFLQCLQPSASNFMTADPQVVQHLLRNLSAIALNHIEEAKNVAKQLPGVFDLKPYAKDKTGKVVEANFRIDLTGTPKKSSHVRLTTASLPSNVLVGSNYSIDALVTFSETGRARFECLHPLPPYFTDCSWILEDCGPFVNAKSMIDAVKLLDICQEECCGVADIILGLSLPSPVLPERAHTSIPRLNQSQNEAIRLALNSSLLCLWGPPGTGKTETIVEMICALQTAEESARLLVTAPTHNAVDNLMRRYIQRLHANPVSRRVRPNVVRVSTEVTCTSEEDGFMIGLCS